MFLAVLKLTLRRQTGVKVPTKKNTYILFKKLKLTKPFSFVSLDFFKTKKCLNGIKTLMALA